MLIKNSYNNDNNIDGLGAYLERAALKVECDVRPHPRSQECHEPIRHRGQAALPRKRRPVGAALMVHDFCGRREVEV